MSWPTTPTRFVLTEVDERGLRDGEHGELLSVSEYHGIIPRIGSASQQAASLDVSHYKRCEPGQLVLNKLWAFRGGLGVSPHTGLVSPDYAVFDIDPSVDPRFVHYQVRSAWFVAEMSKRLRGIGSPDASLGRAPRINVSDLGRIQMHTPPIEVQRPVADMLDAETARIDTLIAKNQRVIELAWLRYRVLRLHRLAGGYLLGSKQALSWAESRGWPVAPLWLLSVNHDSRRIPLNAEERGARQGPYPYWGANSIQDHVDGWLFDGPHVLIGEDGAPFFVENRDVAWVAEGRYWVNNHAHVLEAVGVEPWWLAECLNIVDYSLFVSGSTRDKLTQDGLNRIPVPTPPRSQRDQVLGELQHARELASAVAERCERQQKLLRRRRQALITAAVTGQIDV